MSRFYVLDIETCPLPEEELLKLMSESLRNPIMPAEIANPIMPEDLASEPVEFKEPSEEELMKDCPAYKTKAHPDGDPEKKKKYRDGQLEKLKLMHFNSEARRAQKKAEWIENAEKKKSAWEERQMEAKQKFIDDGALSAVTGSVKLIGLRDYLEGKDYIHVVGATEEEKKKLYAATYPNPILFLFWDTEAECLENVSMDIDTGVIVPTNKDNESSFQLIGFFTHGFDWPFVTRRSWINGVVGPMSLRKGRYWNDAMSVDLHEVWQLGDRQEKCGGLDGLAKILGTKRKAGNGESFHRLWSEDCVAAVLYLISDLDAVQELAEKMGLVYRPRETEFSVKGIK